MFDMLEFFDPDDKVVKRLRKMPPYEKRVVARVEAEDNNGIAVSTAWSPDHGYETALCDDYGIYPVERYKTFKAAKGGQERWLKQAKVGLRIKALGVQGPEAIGYTGDEIVILRLHDNVSSIASGEDWLCPYCGEIIGKTEPESFPVTKIGQTFSGETVRMSECSCRRWETPYCTNIEYSVPGVPYTRSNRK